MFLFKIRSSVASAFFLKGKNTPNGRFAVTPSVASAFFLKGKNTP